MHPSVSTRPPGGAEQRLKKTGHKAATTPASVIERPQPVLLKDGCRAVVAIPDLPSLTAVLAPQSRASLREQAREVLSSLQSILAAQNHPMGVVVQTVFLRKPEHRAECERLFAAQFGGAPPLSNYLPQPPACGAELALEAWAVDLECARVERFGAHALGISGGGGRWVYCAGVTPAPSWRRAYDQTIDGLRRMQTILAQAGSGFANVLRTWFYLGGITEPEDGTERYKELNRARADFYQDITFSNGRPEQNKPRSGVYPASTGIGMTGVSLVMSCAAFHTDSPDARLVALENPRQTPAYRYHPRYSPKSPKFSRGVALQLGDCLITWVSGTASIVDSETHHLDDLERQTEQTIDNIQHLIARENLAAHGLETAGASLHDFASLRVYLKRPSYFSRCKAICNRRFGVTPTAYSIADICRPELLVEIEGVAFSRVR